ncbi:unnamed protein product, partial [Urochloa humidicola]
PSPRRPSATSDPPFGVLPWPLPPSLLPTRGSWRREDEGRGDLRGQLEFRQRRISSSTSGGDGPGLHGRSGGEGPGDASRGACGRSDLRGQHQRPEPTSLTRILVEAESTRTPFVLVCNMVELVDE